MTIKVLRDRKAALLKEADELAAKDAAKTISADETARYAAIIDTDLPAVNESIKRQEALMDEKRSMGTVESESADTVAEAAARVPAQPRSKDGKPAFSSFGEQLQAIAKAGMNKGNPAGVDSRLQFQAAAGANEAVPSEGGFLVQQDYSTALLEKMHDMGEILARIRRIPLSGTSNGIKLPAIDEDSRANGSRFGGVTAEWVGEGDTTNASKPKFRALELNLHKLLALGYATEELLADAAALQSVMETAFVEELTFKTEDAVINGDGAGKPLGILNSGALVTVAKESGQAADSVVSENIFKMWSRLPIRSRKNAVWISNQDVEPQLYGLTRGSGTAVQLMYQPPGTSGNPTDYGLLMNKPVIPIEYAAGIGDVGDLILFDPTNYVMIDKNGIQQAASMHVRFIYDEMTFRFTFRTDGQPVWKKAVTPYKGANTLSPYVALAAR